MRQHLFRLHGELGRDMVDGSPLLALAAGVEHDLDATAALLGDLGAPNAPDLDGWLTQRRAARRARPRRAQEDRIETLESAGGALPLALWTPSRCRRTRTAAS